MEIRVEAKGLEPLIRNLDRMTQQARMQVIAEEFQVLGFEMEATLRKSTPIGATGHLRASTMVEVHNFGDSVVLVVSQPATNQGKVYRSFVVRGRRPGKQPYSRWLLPWVLRKWTFRTLWRAKSASFLLARHIGMFGTKPNPYPQRALYGWRHSIQYTANRIGRAIVIRIMDI